MSEKATAATTITLEDLIEAYNHMRHAGMSRDMYWEMVAIASKDHDKRLREHFDIEEDK